MYTLKMSIGTKILFNVILYCEGRGVVSCLKYFFPVPACKLILIILKEKTAGKTKPFFMQLFIMFIFLKLKLNRIYTRLTG